MSIVSSNILSTSQKRSRGSVKGLGDQSEKIFLFKKQNSLGTKLNYDATPSKCNKQNLSLPNLKQPRVILSFKAEDSRFKTRVAQELICKRTETLVAYRIRLRALLDSEFVQCEEVTPATTLNTSNNILEMQISKLPSKKQPIVKKLSVIPQAKQILRSFKTNSDAYYYTNILSTPGFSSFYSLLHIFTEICSPFAYCCRIVKETVRNEVFIISSGEFTYQEPEIVVKESQIKKTVSLKVVNQRLENVYLHLRNVTCVTKVVIVNFNSVFDVVAGEIIESAKEPLRSINPHFHLVVVVEEEESKQVFGVFEKSYLKVSAIYTRKGGKGDFIEYSQIFHDFHCSVPSEECLIITHHRIVDSSEVSSETLIGTKSGTCIKIHAHGLPITTQEFINQPTTILIPHPTISSYNLLLIRLLSDLNDYLTANFRFRNTFDFEKILTQNPYNFLISDLPQRAYFLNTQTYGVDLTTTLPRLSNSSFHSNLFIY